MRPAWSEQFDTGRLAAVTPLPVAGPITREWAYGDGSGAGVRVAVVDSGVDGDHPWVGGVAGGVALEPDPDTAGGVRVVDGPHEDLFGHGTACAAIIRRLAPAAEIYSVRVLGATLKGRATVFAGGLRWAVDHGMAVVNLSLSTGRPEWFGPLHELVDDAYFRRVVCVSAVNNVPAPSFPSQYATVLSVAAHAGLDPERFDWNPAPPVELGAPGIGVEVAWSGGGTMPVTGNSFAAPHIAGHVARILGAHPELTPFQVKTVLHALADNARPASG